MLQFSKACFKNVPLSDVSVHSNRISDHLLYSGPVVYPATLGGGAGALQLLVADTRCEIIVSRMEPAQKFGQPIET